MNIKRNSKCVWTINGDRIDTRRKAAGNRPKFSDDQEALMLYFERRNPNVHWSHLDARVCGLINRSAREFAALRYQAINVK